MSRGPHRGDGEPGNATPAKKEPPRPRLQQTRRAFLASLLALSGALALRRFRSPSRRPITAAVHARSFGDLDTVTETDVCIVGSGPAGAVLARTLASRAIATLVVESGPDRESRAHATHLDELDAYTSPGELQYPVGGSRFRGAGGTSNLWTGTCPRFHPIDFEPNAYTPSNASWPIRYDDLEPFYVRAEEELSVRGVNDTPFAPRRSSPFRRSLTASVSNLQRLMQRSATPIALQQLPWSNWHGRPVNMAETHLPDFSALPHGTLVCGATATRLLCDVDGRITGVRLQAVGQSPRTVRARVYVIACGGIETARLLLLSRCPPFPDGIGNHSDLVGRCFMEHPSVVIGTGTMRGLWNPWSSKERAFSEQFMLEAKRQGLGGVRLRLLAPRDRPGFDLRHPLQSVHDDVRALRHVSIDLKAQIEMEPSLANRVRLDASRRDAFGDPGASLSLRFTDNDQRTIRYAEKLVRRLLAELVAEHIAVTSGALMWDHHHMGTCRMGDDPRTSVVDRDLRIHGTDNVYIAGSAPFVTSGVSNPTLTIVALTLRLGDHLTERLRRA